MYILQKRQAAALQYLLFFVLLSQVPVLEAGVETGAEASASEFRGDARRSLASSSESPSRRSAPEAHGLASGHDGSESSSINDSENVAFVVRLPRKSWARTRDALSTSSDSSYLEDDAFTRATWARGRAPRPEYSEMERETGHSIDLGSYAEYEDDVFNDRSSASSLELTHSLPFQRQEVHQGSGSFLEKGKNHSSLHEGDNAGTTSLVKSGTPGQGGEDILEASRAGIDVSCPSQAAYEGSDGDDNWTNSGVSKLGSLVKQTSPVIRAKTARRLKRERSAATNAIDQPPDSPPPWTTASQTVATALRDTSHQASVTRTSVKNWELRQLSAPLASAEPQSPTKYFAYIPHLAKPNPATLQRFEALHKAKEAFVSKEGPVILVPSGACKGAADSAGRGIRDESPTSSSPPLATLADGSQHDDEDSSAKPPIEKSVSFLSLKLRRGKKKEYQAVGELCRQTLPVAVQPEQPPPTSPRSPSSPSSPESSRTRAFGRNKWLPLFVTKS